MKTMIKIIFVAVLMYVSFTMIEKLPNITQKYNVNEIRNNIKNGISKPKEDNNISKDYVIRKEGKNTTCDFYKDMEECRQR